MHNRTLSFALAALLWGAVLPAVAEEAFVPAVTVPATESQIGTRAIDILDLVPGMTPHAIQSALSTLRGADGVVPMPTFFEAGSRGVTVRTAEFLDTMRAGSDDDRIDVMFTGPASANQAFAIERKVRYSDVLTAPTVAAITEALEAKYGAPSYDAGAFREVVTPELVWVFSGNEQVSCQGFGGYGTGRPCPVAWTLSEYTPQRQAAETPVFDYAIVANIETHQADRTKVSRFTVTVADLARRQQAARADVEAIEAELDRVHQEASRPAPAPAL